MFCIKTGCHGVMDNIEGRSWHAMDGSKCGGVDQLNKLGREEQRYQRLGGD